MAVGVRSFSGCLAVSDALPEADAIRAQQLRLIKSSLTTLSLPESVCEGIASYAELKNASRNQVYSRFLQQGLLIYLKAQAIALGSKLDPNLIAPSQDRGLWSRKVQNLVWELC